MRRKKTSNRGYEERRSAAVYPRKELKQAIAGMRGVEKKVRVVEIDLVRYN